MRYSVLIPSYELNSLNSMPIKKDPATETPTQTDPAARTADTESILSAIIGSSDDAIISKDLDGIITSWNLGAERMFGYSADEVIGRPINIIIPPDRQDEETRILRKIKNGEKIDHFETVRRRKDGTLID